MRLLGLLRLLAGHTGLTLHLLGHLLLAHGGLRGWLHRGTTGRLRVKGIACERGNIHIGHIHESIALSSPLPGGLRVAILGLGKAEHLLHGGAYGVGPQFTACLKLRHAGQINAGVHIARNIGSAHNPVHFRLCGGLHGLLGKTG